MHRELFNKVIENKQVDTMKKLGDLFLEMLDKLEEIDNKFYCEIKDALYVMAYGEHLTDKMAALWVSKMKNKDGSFGGKWTEQDTTQLAKQLGISFDSFNEHEWFAVMNMMYSDYYGSVQNDVNTYAKLAKDWMKDDDISDISGKTYRYYKYVVEN